MLGPTQHNDHSLQDTTQQLHPMDAAAMLTKQANPSSDNLFLTELKMTQNAQRVLSIHET
jgi:hypothetical protein